METFIIDKSTLDRILSQNQREVVFSKDIQRVILPATKSKIIMQNANQVYVAKYKGLAGLFSKEELDTKAFGRSVCDFIKHRFQSYGFFTTDELPRYGITRAEARLIAASIEKEKSDLVIILAYQEHRAREINEYLSDLLEKIIYAGNNEIDLQSIDNEIDQDHIKFM